MVKSALKSAVILYVAGFCSWLLVTIVARIFFQSFINEAPEGSSVAVLCIPMWFLFMGISQALFIARVLDDALSFGEYCSSLMLASMIYASSAISQLGTLVPGNVAFSVCFYPQFLLAFAVRDGFLSVLLMCTVNYVLFVLMGRFFMEHESNT